MEKKLNFTLQLLSVILCIAMLSSYIPMTAFTAENSKCAAEDCTGTYINGFCTVCDGYEEAKKNDDGCYEIGNAGQLYWFAALSNEGDSFSGDAVLTSDITVNEDLSATDKRMWTPIASMFNNKDQKYYSGTFDGNGYTIRGLYCEFKKSYRAALFGYCRNSVLKNITIEDSYFYGYQYASAFAGSISDSKVINCHSIDNEIIAEVAYAGGVVCMGTGRVTIDRCSNTSEVKLTEEGKGSGLTVGGIVGWTGIYNVISNCWNSGLVRGRNGGAGGIVGCQGDYLTIENCYNVGDVTSVNGDNESYSPIMCSRSTEREYKIKNCYYLKADYADSHRREGTTEKTAEEFRSGEVTWLLNGSKSEGVWKQTLGEDDYPDFDGKTVYYQNNRYTNTYHNHQWQYVVSDNSITANCIEEDCFHNNGNGGSVKLIVKDGEYTGEPIGATAEGNFTNGATYKITYDNGSENAPSVGGTHTAILTVYENDEEKQKLSVDYPIDQINGSVTNISDISKIYDGSAVSAPTFDKIGTGTVAVQYKEKDADDSAYTTTAPVDAGEYVVRVTVEADANYRKSSATADFKISKATYDMTTVKWDYTEAFQYDALEKSVAVVGLPKGVTVSSYTNEKATAVGAYTAKVTFNYDSKNYNAPELADLEWKIENNWIPAEYTVNGEGWLNYDFVITPSEGYKVSLSNTSEAIWNDSLIISEEGENTIIFYLKNDESGAISLPKAVTCKLDKTSATGKVYFDERNIWESFLNTISFGLFFKDEVIFNVDATDNISGVESIEYYLSDKGMTLEQVEAITDWTTYSDSIAVTLDDAKQFVYYVRITDKAGNITYLSTDGVKYDTKAPVINGIENGKTYYTTQHFTVQEDNLDSVKINDEDSLVFTLKGNVGKKYVIVAADKAGNSTTFTVSMKPISDIASTIDGITKENVTSEDKDSIQAVIDKVTDLLNDDNLTEEERKALEEAKKEAEELINAIDRVATEINDIKDKLDDYKKESVTSADKENIQSLIDRINDLLKDDNLTEDERKALEEAKKEAEELIGQIESADAAKKTENIKKVENVTAENVTPENKTDLEKAKADFEKALENYNGNYTEEEKKAIQEEIKGIGDALKVIENVESVEEIISKLPETITKNDEEAVKAANDAYNALTDYEKSLLAEDILKSLDDANAALAELNKTVGPEKPTESTDSENPTESEFDKATEPNNSGDTTSPETGDSSNLWLWIAIFFVSGTGILGLILNNYKRKKRIF